MVRAYRLDNYFRSGTTSITVTTGTAGQNGNIQVNAINACGIGYASGSGSGYQWVTVDSVPSAPGTAGPNSPSCTGFTAQWAYKPMLQNIIWTYRQIVDFQHLFRDTIISDVGNVLNYSLTGLNRGQLIIIGFALTVIVARVLVLQQ